MDEGQKTFQGTISQTFLMKKQGYSTQTAELSQNTVLMVKN